VKVPPESAEAHFLLARAYGLAGKQDQMQAQLNRALELDPNSVNTLLLRGSERCFVHEYDEGVAAVERAAQLDPLSPLAPLMLELCYTLAQQPAKVIEAHGRAQAIDPSFVYFESWAGGAYREMGDYASALREYLLAEQHLDGLPQTGLALTYVRMGRAKDAREVMRQMDERARSRYFPFALRAIVHAAVGDWEGAAPLLRQAVDQREGVLLAFRSTAEMKAMETHPRTKDILEQVDALRKAM
jgi:tetratricopeptide (TPR) repeat protein